MNIPVRALVPTQARAIERHNKFRQSIADQAAKLQASKSGPVPRPVRIRSEAAVQLPPMPCGLPSWYFIMPPADLEPVDGSAPRAEPRVAFIMQCVARYFGISHTEMISDRRMHRIVRPRQIAFYLCSQLTRQSLIFIGRQFGKDHTTVLHAVRKMTRLIHQDSDLAYDIATLTHAITGKYQ